MMIILYGIATGMKVLYGHRIMHRDLKPENVLLNDNVEPKVAKTQDTLQERLLVDWKVSVIPMGEIDNKGM
jgi:serine/threonine protein kinase